MKRTSIVSAIATALFMLFCLVSSDASADDILLDNTAFSKQYMLQISGTVMNETFSGAQALLTIMPPSPGSLHPYQIMIQGLPRKNSRNTFFWHTDSTEMTVLANEISSEIKRNMIHDQPIHFFFLSPALLNQTIFHTQQDDDQKRLAEETALPTRIAAQAGKLKLRMHSNSVSGTIWMKGYDHVEKAYVQYGASLYGKRAYHLEQNQQIKK